MPLLDARDGPSYGAIPRDEREENQMNPEQDHLLQDGYETEGDPSDVSMSETQEGVRKIEAINMTWTTRSLMIAYIRFVWLAAGPTVINQSR